MKQAFFEPTQNYTELTRFLATQRIVETSLRGLELAKTDFSAAMVYFGQVYRNSMNDIIVQNTRSLDFFLETLNTEKSNFEKSTRFVLILALVMLALQMIGSAWLIWRQYKTETLVLVGFIKLDKSKIDHVAANINSFRSIILAETPLEDAHFEESLLKISHHHQRRHENNNAKKTKNYAKKYESVIPHSSGIIRRFIFHFIKILALLVFVLSYVITIFAVPQKTIADLYIQVNQAFLSDTIGLNADFALISSILALNVDSMQILVLNTPAPMLMLLEVYMIQGFQSQILAGITSSDWNFGYVVTEIFSGDGCGYAVSDRYAKMVCDTLGKGSEKINIISLLGLFQSGLEERYTQYNNSDKSYESLRNITKETFDEVTLPHTVLQFLASSVSDLVDQSYDEATDKANRDSLINLCMICLLLVITGSLSWWAVLRPVQETDNKMKNVLQMLPSNIVLSNFILKNYLVKTSNGTLNFVRNNI